MSETHWCFNNNNQCNLPHGWSVEISSFYVSPALDAQFTPHFREQTNVDIQNKVLKNQGFIRVSTRDIFRSNFSAGNITNIPGVAATLMATGR